jgi:hypothetical protein
MFWKLFRAIDWVIDALLLPVSYLVLRARVWWMIYKMKRKFPGLKVTVIEFEVTIKRPK